MNFVQVKDIRMYQSPLPLVPLFHLPQEHPCQLRDRPEVRGQTCMYVPTVLKDVKLFCSLNLPTVPLWAYC